MLELDEIIFDNTNYDRRIFALHGAAVEWKGKGYLFLAATASGKTTLASYLTSQGFGYITDDCILLDWLISRFIHATLSFTCVMVGWMC